MREEISNQPPTGMARCLRLVCIVVLAAWVWSGPLQTWCAHAASPESTYQPVFAKGGSATAPADRGTLGGDFAWAASAETLGAARDRWLEFLTRHDSPEGSYEDNFHLMRVTAALYELARIFYLMGNAETGDAYLRKADPLNLN